MSALEDLLAAELESLLRAEAPVRAVRITVREIVVERFTRAPLGAREVTNAVEAAVRAICRLARDRDAPDELVEAVCRAALEAVRGHGGESARWLPDATAAASSILDELAGESGGRAPEWRLIARHLERWEYRDLRIARE